MIDNPRLDLLIAKHGRLLVIGLLVVGVLALLATGWVVANPPTSTTTEEVNEESVSTEATTSAVVVEDGLWEEGTVLEGSSVYLYDSTPEVTVTPQTTVPSDDASVVHEVWIVHEADRDGSTFWDERNLLDRSAVAVEDGVASSEITFEIDDVRDRRAELDDRLVGVGSIETELEIVVEYDTGRYSDEQTLTSQIELAEQAYWFEEDDLSDTTPHSETATIDVQESPNPVTIGGLLLLAVLAIGSATFVRGRGPIDVESARRAVHEQRYDSWISEGSIPMWVGDYHVELDTLEDVVDVAIDTNERVVHDRQRSLFAVVNGAVVYYYSERGPWEGTTWPKMDFGGGPSPVAGELDGVSSSSPLDSGDLLDLSGTDESGDAPFSTDDLPDPDDDDAWEKI